MATRIYNYSPNILELHNILVQVRFATSKTKLDIKYNKLRLKVASQVAARLKTYDLKKLGYFRNISNLGGDIA